MKLRDPASLDEFQAMKDRNAFLEEENEKWLRFARADKAKFEKNCRFQEALEWIRDASDVGTNKCSGCGQATGVLAMHLHAKRALGEEE